MIIINTVNAKRFSLNGIEYFKNYISEVAGNQLTVFNAYDRKDVKVEWSSFNNFIIDGVTFANVADLQSALLDVIYTRASLGNTGAVTSVNEMTGDVVISTGYSAIETWDGTSTIPVPSGFLGKVLNFNNGTIVTYTVAGTDLMVTGTAYNGDLLILSN